MRPRLGHVGYRIDETRLKVYGPSRALLVTRTPVGEDKRLIVAPSLGCHIQGVAMPQPDIQHAKSLAAGAVHRFLREMPDRDPALFARLIAFGEEFNSFFTPLGPDVGDDNEEWLASTSYSAARQAELREVRKEVESKGGLWAPTLSKKTNFDIGTFMKDEAYPEYKFPRNINARKDETKVYAGAWFKAIEKILFAHPAFIKKVPVRERPKYILDLLEGAGTVRASDFTSMEATFVPAVIRLEISFYKHMTRYVSWRADFWRFLDWVLAGLNKNDSRYVTFWVEARRQSGEMNTSLGNGYFNMLINLFAYHEMGIDWKTIKYVIEGDDGLFKSPTGQHPDSDFYRRLGAIVKLIEVPDISSASFCGLIFDPEELANISDPRKVLATLGITTHKYAHSRDSVHRALLRSKGLSIAYQYPNTPIFSAVARWILRVTSGSDVAATRFLLENHAYKWAPGDLALWKDHPNYLISAMRSELDEITGQPGLQTRLLMERIFDVTVAMQERIEEYFDSLTDIRPLIIPLDFHADWYDYANRFSVLYEAGCGKVPFEDHRLQHLDLSKYIKIVGDTAPYV